MVRLVGELQSVKELDASKLPRSVHPVADLFPMLADDELRELAADIAERGLLQPLVVDAEGRLLDGRNRLAACELAGVEPTFTTYEGDDPDGYALAVNGQRRDLTKSKRAMIAAQAKSLVTKDWGGQARLAQTLQVSESLLSQATAVAKHGDLARQVLAGTSLTDAYKEALGRKKAAEDTDAGLALLRAQAPDLVDLVIDERLTLAGALGELRERERKAAERQRDARALLTRIVDLIAPPSASDGFVDTWADHLGGPDADLDQLILRSQDALDVLTDLSNTLLKRRVSQ